MNKLTRAEEYVIVHKGTEPPFTGEYDHFFQDGTYVCRRCDTPLYTSTSKFNSGCGWPAFDDEIAGAVKRLPDPDGLRQRMSTGRPSVEVSFGAFGSPPLRASTGAPVRPW